MSHTDNSFKSRINEYFREFVDSHCITKDFPKEGVNFIDIFPIIKRYNLDEFNMVLSFPETLILVPEARGFLFASKMDWQKIVPLRKKNKLPGETMEITYQKEYGEDSLFFQTDCIVKYLDKLSWNKNIPVPVCFFDDILATGGTAKAVTEYFNNLELDGYTFEVVSNKFYVEILGLRGRDILNSILNKSGNAIEVESIYEY